MHPEEIIINVKEVFKIVLVLFFIFLNFYFLKAAAVSTPEYPMNVTFEVYYSIIISDKLAEGILFTNLTGSMQNVQYPLIPGSFDNNATWNYNSSDASKKTEYTILVSGNANLDICNGATNNLCSTPGCSGFNNEEILIGNVTWKSSTTGSPSGPSGSTPMVVGYDNTNKIRNVAPDTVVYMRYWFDVPSNSSALNYNTTYQIQGVISGGACA